LQWTVVRSGADGWILTSCEDERGESERVEDIAHIYRLEVRTTMRWEKWCGMGMIRVLLERGEAELEAALTSARRS
jgi:hypothetical protein